MSNSAFITNLARIEVPEGNVFHAMKKSSNGYSGFGEAYFSKIKFGSIKGWKRHKNMILNIIVPVGEIKFVIYDDRDPSSKEFQEFIISCENYCRLTVPPMLWLGFQGLAEEESMLLNIANIEHDPNEVDRLDVDMINYNWGFIS